MKYFIIATIISAAGAAIVWLTNGNSVAGAALIVLPWLFMVLITYIERNLKK